MASDLVFAAARNENTGVLGRQSVITSLACVLGAAGLCLLPTPWLSFPAAALLVMYWPGRAVIRLLRPVAVAPGADWSALTASLVLMPVPLHWLWRFSNARGAVLGVVTAINALLVLAAHYRGTQLTPPVPVAGRAPRRMLRMLLIWVAACVFGAYWLPGAGGRTVPVPIHDYIKHHAVMLSLERHPLPLHNIFYAAEADTPCYYYEYHYLVPASLRCLTNHRVSIAFAFGFTAAAVAIAFVAVVFLIAKDHARSDYGALLAAGCVSVIGGWDIVPTLARLFAGAPMVVTLDAWCPVAWRIHNIMTQFLWCPQHVAAVLALLLACRWLRAAPTAAWWVPLAPLLSASLFGSSVYLAMTIFPAAAVHVLLRWRRTARANRASARRLLAAVSLIVVAGVALMTLQAYHYVLMSRRYPGSLTWRWERFPAAVLGRLAPPGPAANFLDAPWLILVDFGLPALACLLIGRAAWRALWRDDGTRLLILAGGFGTAALFTLRSDINPIDYSFRVSILPAMAMAAVCAGILADPDRVRPWIRSRLRPIIAAGVLLGLPVGLYEAPVTAIRTFLSAGPERQDAGAIRFLRHDVPADAVVQGDPRYRLRLVQLIDRQMGVLDPTDPDVRVFYPLDPARMAAAFAEVERALAARSAQAAHTLLRSWRVTHVLAGSAEHRRFGTMDPFRDAAWFESVYNDGHAAVYRLRSVRDSP